MRDIGIERDAVGIIGISPEVPPDIRAKLAKANERLRKEAASMASP